MFDSDKCTRLLLNGTSWISKKIYRQQQISNNRAAVSVVGCEKGFCDDLHQLFSKNFFSNSYLKVQLQFSKRDCKWARLKGKRAFSGSY